MVHRSVLAACAQPKASSCWAVVCGMLLASVGHGDESNIVEGFTEPFRQIELAVGESGVLEAVNVEEGSRVEAGQILAQLENSVLETTLEIARQRSQSTGQLLAAQAEAELQLKYARQLQELRDKGHATQRELDRALTDLRIADAKVVIAQEEIALQQLECRRIEAQIERRRIRSPIDGLVSDILRDAGECFLGNDLHVMTIVQLDRLRVKFSLEPELLRGLQVGESVQLRVGTASELVQGTVDAISPVMDAKSATIELTVCVDNPQERIASGVRCWLLLSDAASGQETVTSYTAQTAAPTAQTTTPRRSPLSSAGQSGK